MGYESDTLPSYHELRNCSYSIKLSCTTSSSIPQVNLTCTGTTITPSDSSPASDLPPCRAHRWGGRPPFPLCPPAVSWCIPLWGGVLRLPVPPLLRVNTTLLLPRISMSAPWYVALPGGGTPPGPWASPPSPPSYHCHTRAPTAPQPYTFLPGPAPLLPFFQHPCYHYTPPQIFLQVLVYRCPITVIVGDRPVYIRESIRRCRGLHINLKRDPTCLEAAL